MVLVRQSLRTKPPFGAFDDPPLPIDGKIICEEEYIQKEIHYPPPDIDFKEKKRKRTPKKSIQLDPVRSIPDESIPEIEIPDKKKLSYTDFIERLITEKSSHNQRQSKSSNPAKVLMAKINNLYSKRDLTSHDKGNQTIERLVERRYFVKQSQSKVKCDALTSTTDLCIHKNKSRRSSTVSSSTRSYIEDFHHQSDLFRNDINQLKTEIQHLHVSQEEFFKQLKSTIDQTMIQQTLDQSADQPLETNEIETIPEVPTLANRRYYSVSIETLSSSTEKATPITRTTVPTNVRVVTPTPSITSTIEPPSTYTAHTSVHENKQEHQRVSSPDLSSSSESESTSASLEESEQTSIDNDFNALSQDSSKPESSSVCVPQATCASNPYRRPIDQLIGLKKSISLTTEFSTLSRPNSRSKLANEQLYKTTRKY